MKREKNQYLKQVFILYYCYYLHYDLLILWEIFIDKQNDETSP